MMLTIFTAPKPFEGHIGVIQRNAIGSWRQLGAEVEILLVGEERGIEQAANDLQARWISEVETNQRGTPLVSSIFTLAEAAATHEHLCYINTDVIVFGDLIEAMQRISTRFPRFLMVGQRWDLAVFEPLKFSEGWETRLRNLVTEHGKLHPPAGSDYFLFPRGLVPSMPNFAIGRAGWDNWMIYAARRAGVPVLDATQAVKVVHQEHDYAHLPGAEPHYRLPESFDNLRLAGGRATVFTLQDATWILGKAGVRKRRGGSWRRRAESNLIARLGPGKLGSLVWSLFHPVQAARGLRHRVSRNIPPNEKPDYQEGLG
jgi:hypothetical protein